MNNNQPIISQLREQLDSGLSVHSLDAIIQTCKGFLSSNSAQPDGLLLPVFALKAVVSSVKHIADDEGFPKDMLRLLDEDERGGGHFLPTLGGVQEHSIINESGLYGVILRSNKPEAKAFRKWVTGEVLPAIRKQGFYKSPEYARITELEREQKSAQYRIEDLDNKAAMLRAELRQAEEKLADYKDAPKLVKLRIDAAKDKERSRAEREMMAFMRRRSALIARQVKIINSALKGLNLRGDYVLGNAVDEIESLISAWVLSDPVDHIEGGAE